MARRGKKSKSKKKKKKGGKRRARDVAEEATPSSDAAPESDEPAAASAAADSAEVVELDGDATDDVRAVIAEASQLDDGDVFDLDAITAAGEEELEAVRTAVTPPVSDDPDVEPDSADAVEVFDLDAEPAAEDDLVFDLDSEAETDTAEVFDLDAETKPDVDIFDLDGGASPPDEPGVGAATETVASELAEKLDVLDVDAAEDDDGGDVFDLDGSPEAFEEEGDAAVDSGAEPAGEPVAEPSDQEDPSAEVVAAASLEDPAPDDGEAEGDPETLPIDVGVTSTPEARARLLAEALAHAEMQEARYRVPTESRRAGRIKGALALSVFGIAGILTIAPPAAVSPPATPRIEAADERNGVLQALVLQAEQIEAFRVREQRLPRTLAELAAPVDGVRYVRSSNRLYQLIGYTPDGASIVFDSANPSPELQALAAAWLREVGS